MQNILKRVRAVQASNRIGIKDLFTASLIFALVLVLGLGILNKGHAWGDDFAGYILHAQALVEGTVEEMAQKNAMLHPSHRSFEEGVVDDSPLVYVWGLPMVLSLVYRLVGYDAPVGETIICYKVPGVIFFALFAAVLYLFFRRRFSGLVSLFLAFMLFSHKQVFCEMNNILTDIPCLAASLVTLLWIELFCEENQTGRKASLGIVLGIAMWYTAIVRLNGITVIYCALLYHVLALIVRPEKGRQWVVNLFPWVLFALLYTITYMLLPEPNSNTSHMAGVTLNRIKDNILDYYDLMESFFGDMLPAWVPGRKGLHLIMYVLIGAGLLDRGWRKEDIHLSILLCGTGIVLLTLPYAQGLRYMFNILPMMILFAAYGLVALARLVGRILRKTANGRYAMGVMLGVIAAVTVLRCTDLVAWKIDDLNTGGRESLYEAYHPASRDIYAYVRENVEDDAIVAYMKPRLLYLNTGKMGFMVGVNGHHFYDADYLLTFKGFQDELGGIVWPELMEELTLVYRNHEYELYRISDAYRSLRYEQE